MDCVGCDKCKLWGKLQVTGLGTALKVSSKLGNILAGNSNCFLQILFWADNTTKKSDRSAAEMAVTEEELQTLQPPKDELHGSAFRLVIDSL